MDKRSSILIALLTTSCLASRSLADTRDAPVYVDNYVVVYAKIKSCPEFPGVLALQQARPSARLELPGIPAIEILGRARSAILEEIRSEIAKVSSRGDPPRSLRIEVLRSREDYLWIREAVASSFEFLSAGRCSNKPRRRTPLEDPSPPYRLEQIALAERVGQAT